MEAERRIDLTNAGCSELEERVARIYDELVSLKS